MRRLTICLFIVSTALCSHLCHGQNANSGPQSSNQTSAELAIGKAVVKSVEHGRFVQYVPKSVTAKSSLLVVCHGMFGSGEAEDAAKNSIDDWFAFGEKHKLIVVAPIFDNENYACTKPGAFGGYRTLTGRVVGADQFLHEIIAVYQEMNAEYDGRFFIFGHSAGAQFTNRYVVRYPDRVLGALISSPAWFSFPDKDTRWAEGMGARKANFKWGDTGERVKVDVTPDPQTWQAANSIPITVIVGELDTDELKDTGKTHVSQASDWVDAMKDFAAAQNVDSQIKLKIVKGVGHNYGKLTRAGMKDLSKAVRSYYSGSDKNSSADENSQTLNQHAAVRNVSLNSIPDLTQTMKSAGFAGGGSQFCAPVAISNSLVWLEGRGNDQNYQIQMVKRLASPDYMHTKLSNGTGTVELMRGVAKYADEVWGDYNRLEYAGWRSCPRGSKVATKPTIKWMVDGLHNRAAVWINVGWYVKSNVGGTTNYARVGGHWVTLVGHANGKLILHDPGHRSGPKPRKELVSYSWIGNGVQTGNKRGLPIEAVGSIELTRGMPISSKANTAIIDGVVIFEVQAPEPFRKWTAANGKSTLTARFAGLKNGKVALETEQGKVITVDLAELDARGQEFIEEKNSDSEK